MAGLPGSCQEMSYVVFYSDTLWQSGTSMTHCSLTTNLKAPQRKCVCISLFHSTTNQVWRWGAGLPPCQWTEVCIKVMNADPPLPHSCPVVAGDWCPSWICLCWIHWSSNFSWPGVWMHRSASPSSPVLLPAADGGQVLLKQSDKTHDLPHGHLAVLVQVSSLSSYLSAPPLTD